MISSRAVSPLGGADRVAEEELLRRDDSVGAGHRVFFGAVLGIDEFRLDFDVTAFARLVPGLSSFTATTICL